MSGSGASVFGLFKEKPNPAEFENMWKRQLIIDN
ncbi:MAG: hypothetical protein LBQ01_09115 [Prevotellaceae bacterium]|jgi:4-diphosphocytidyl-2C-methyl-D-erythritol kinase|nr:hypothetical protein [Prevotellaceae bacterium]